MLERGEVAGVFQVEGAGMRRLMMEMKPRRFDHIIAAISLYRPGPMENIPEYIRRMHADIFDGKNIVEYHTPKLEPILNDTYGIIVYQEQIIRIASDLAGYSPGDADMIRKAVAKKKKKLMEEHRIKFTDGAMANGLTRETCDAIWGDIEFFARYGFNKAHAADYAKVTCQTAFLKSHYPVEYLTAMLSVERDNTEKVRRYFAEAKNLGIDVAPPDINKSRLDFTIEDDGERPLIRFGLGAIKNAGAAALLTIIDERIENGEFSGLDDLCERVDLKRVGKRPLEYMTKGHVFDAWGTPPQFMDALDRIVNYSASEHASASTGQMSLFGGGGSSAPTLKVAVDLLHPEDQVEPVEHKMLLEWEKEALGVHVSEHPLERPLAQIAPMTNTTISAMDVNWNARSVKIAGMISTVRPLTTKKGDPMAFGTLEDLDGKIDLVFFPKTWQMVRENVKVDQVMLVVGKIQARGEDLSILVDNVIINPTVNFSADEDSSVLGMSYQNGNGAQQQSQNKTAVANGQNNDNGDYNNGNGHSNGRSQTPPPPDNFAEDAPTSNHGAPPPPPNFDAEDIAVAQSTVPMQTPAVKQEVVAPPQPKPEVKPQLHTAVSNMPVPNQNLTIVIEVKPVGNWQETIRRALRLINEYEGEDGLTIKLTGQDLQMDFPNRNTRSCGELFDALRMIPSIHKVFNQ